jgi:hypothetical protein
MPRADADSGTPATSSARCGSPVVMRFRSRYARVEYQATRYQQTDSTYTTTANDIEDDTGLDIILQAMAVEQRPEHPAVFRSVHCRDLDCTPIVLNEFEDARLDALLSERFESNVVNPG